MATILIVDDEPVILDVLRRFLEGDSRRLVLAASCAEALREAGRAGPIDVALVDKNLGDGSGLDLARKLRALKSDVEIILLTGYASLDSAIEAVQIGAYDYVTKPVSDYDALNLKIENAIEKVRMKQEHRALLARLTASEERHRGVFETSSDALLLFDPERGRIEDANPAALRLYRYSRDELRERTLPDLFDPEGGVPDLLRDGRSIPARHRTKDGKSFPVELALGDASRSEHALCVCSVRDVSERERAEQDRRQLEESLRQAQKMEAIGRLAGGVAHDFSNILAVILGYSELLLRDLPQDARARESADGIVEAANRAAGVTRQLLTLSRKKLLNPEILSLSKVVGDLGKLLGRAIGERIELTMSLAPDLWPVEADADQLAQVLLNLVVNARDAMPEGGSLRIETANESVPEGQAGLAAGNYVRLRVEDTGCGMTDEVRTRMFEPFFTTKESGTGLGLATVYGIVRQAGGTVRVDSRVGNGTTFTLHLPAVAAERARAELSTPRAPRAATPGETVLLAEDEEPLRRLIARALMGEGYEVIEGRNGAEALAAARAHPKPIQLLLADVVMPRLSGQALAERLGAEHPGLKVLFMTGHSDDPFLRDHLLQGRVELIHKPFTSEALLVHVRRVLDLDVAA